MVRSSKEPEGAREALIAAARKLFAQDGYDATSVKTLSDEAQVNISLVSYHFGGKEGLYYACLEEFAKARLAVAERILVPPASAEELKVRSRMFIEEMIDCCQTEPEVTKIIDRDIHLGKPMIERVFHGTFLKVYETCVEFFRVAQKNGVVRPEFDPMLAAGLLMGSVMHLNRMESISKKILGRSLADPKFRKMAVDHIQAIFSEALIEQRGGAR